MNLSTLVTKVHKRMWFHFWKVKCRISPQKIERFRLPGGGIFDYPLNSAVGSELFTGGFEKSEAAFVRRSLKEGDVFFDVGANGGFYTIMAAKKVGSSGHVYAFEPGLRELELLKHNIVLNKLTNVIVIESGVSNQIGTAKFAISKDGAMNSLSENQHHAQKIEDWQTIQTTTLDEAVRQHQLSHVDFIKVDVEGAEKLVFDGASNLLNSDYPITVLFEAVDACTVGFSYSVRDLLEAMKQRGLYLYYLDSSETIHPISEYLPSFGREIYNFIARTQSFEEGR